MRITPLSIILFILLSFFTRHAYGASSIPFQYKDGMIWVKVGVAGKTAPLNFLLDSGAGATVVDLGTAKRLGLKLSDRQSVLGVNGRSMAYRVDSFIAHVSDTAISTRPLATDLSAASRQCHRHIDGLLGADFFREHIVEINFGTRTLRLLQREEVNRSDCETLPLTRRNDTLCARVSVAGSGPEWLRLDTGCNTALEWVVSSEKAKSLGTTANPSKSIPEVQTDLQLGGLKVASVKTGLHTEQMFANESGLIGNGLLSRFTVTIDAARQQFLLAKR